MDKNGELKFLGKFKKIIFFWGGGRVVGGGGGGQGGFERRIEVCENLKKNGGVGGSGGGSLWLEGGQGGCE